MIDKQTFEQIFRHHYDGMFRLARRMLGDDAESKDVVSDVFASLLGKDETELKTDTLQGTQYLICRQIIREHDAYSPRRGCRIYVENTSDGQGSTFIFTLPKL